MYKKDTIKVIIENWKKDLNDNLKKFNSQAQNARKWEDQLYSNKKTIAKMVYDLTVVHKNQEELDAILTKISEYQVRICPPTTSSRTFPNYSLFLSLTLSPPPTRTYQGTLDKTLEDIERGLDSLPPAQHQSSSENAEKRGQVYELVDKLQHRLESMESSLSALSKDFNSSRGGSYDAATVLGGSRENSVAQTVEILNHQFEMLAQLDERTHHLTSSMTGVGPALRAVGSGQR